MSDHHKLVPRDLLKNLRWRRALHRLCTEEKTAREDVLEICRRDVVFWVNAFAWTLDPRKLSTSGNVLGSRIPFLTWDYQDDAFQKLEECLNAPSDVLIEKSRDMGASWITCTWMLWRWLFHDYQSFLMVSRKEVLVDGDEDSLFSHLRIMLGPLPRWMLAPGSFNDFKLQLKNKRNGSVIDGESTTKNIGRGGRRTAILLDEFPAFEQGGFEVLAATADTTNCRLFNGTPSGTANAFYAQREKGTPRIRMHWSLHPDKRKGLYRVLGPGEFEFLDKTFNYAAYSAKTPLVDEVPRSLEGVRSPWYDEQCKRRAHAWEIAQELDIDYQGSAFPFFDPRMLDELKNEYCKAPLCTGAIQQTGNPETPKYEFFRSVKGALKLWVRLDHQGRPPCDREYLVGCDVSQGTGASDSVATVVDSLSGEKVGEMAGNRWSVNRFAELVYALCEFFTGTGPAHLIWEATGPGRTFGKVIVEELHYRRIYMHKDDRKFGAVPTDRYGWFSNLDSKRDLLQTYREMLASRAFLNYSLEALREAGFYVFENNRVEYRGPTSTNDPSNSGVNHGDRVIADALAAKLLFEYKGGVHRGGQNPADPPVMSKAWRDKMWVTAGDDGQKVLVDAEW